MGSTAVPSMRSGETHDASTHTSSMADPSKHWGSATPGDHYSDGRHVDHEKVPDEFMDYLGDREMEADILLLTRISKDGCQGLIDGIGCGTQSGAKFYRIYYG